MWAACPRRCQVFRSKKIADNSFIKKPLREGDKVKTKYFFWFTKEFYFLFHKISRICRKAPTMFPLFSYFAQLPEYGKREFLRKIKLFTKKKKTEIF